MVGLNWYIMTDDDNYYCGVVDGKYKISTDEDEAFIFESKEEAYKMEEKLKVTYPESTVYVDVWGELMED